MVRNMWKKLIVWQLILSLFIPMMPLELAQDMLLVVQAKAEAAAAARSTESNFMALVNSVEGLDVLEDGQWRYAVYLTTDSVFLNHSLDASHLVSSSRQRKVWPTTTSPQAISMCREGALRQADIRFKVAYTEPSKEAFSCHQDMKKVGGDWVYGL